jgi:ABC-type nitrate/sulfonate/bicarbonate transport system substrate-binding protein
VATQQITSSQSVAALLASQVDMALVGGPETLSAAAGGGDLKVVAVATPVYPYVFYANPSITSPAQLKGAKIAITRPGATLDIAVRVALTRMGLRPESDVTFIATGSVPNVTAALLSGQVQGSVSHPPDSLQLEQKGFHGLYDLAKQKIPYDSVGLTARGAWVTANKDAVQRFVDGLVEAIQRERKDKQFSVSVLQKYLKLTDQQLLSQTYDFYAGEVVQPLPYPSATMFKDAQQLLGASNAKVSGYDVDKMLDPSFLRSSASRGLGR